MKKTIGILLALVMIVSYIPVLADVDISQNMETVLLNVKSKVDIPEKFSEFSPYSYEQNGKAYYTFDWSKEDGKGNISVSCDEKGRITNYYFYDNTLKSEKKLTSLSKDDIVKFAEDFLKKTAPEAYEDENNNFCYDDNSWFVSNNSYKLTFKRMYSDVEVKDNYADFRIVVYDDVAYVRNMDIAYNYDSDFSHGSVNELESVYMEAFPVELIYKDVYSYNYDDKKDENKTVLVYRNKNNEAGYILASSGEVVTEDENNELFFGNAGGGVMEDATVENNKNMLTEKEIEELENVKGIISKADADKFLRNIPGVDISSDMKLSSYNITKQNEKYFVTLTYNTEDKEAYKYLTATLEGLTGKLINLSSSGRQSYDAVTLTEVQKKVASEKADAFLNAVAPDEFAQCREHNAMYNNFRYSRDYDRYVNGVRYINDGINITMDAELGKVTYYSLDFETDKIFDDPSNAISNYTAYKCMFDVNPLKLIWVLSGGEYVECWTLGKYGVLVDAFTGEEYNENIYFEQKTYDYSDIKGHWAEEKITKLAEIQIGFDGDKFNPDTPISQYDLLRLFAAGIHYRDYLTYPEDMLYENFIYDGILTEEEKNSDGQVLREDAFVYMVRLDGLEKVAKLSSIFKVEYADENLLSKGKIGYPAILTGMNVICGNGGYLKPKTPITRAEAAVMVYNYMINVN